MVQVVQVVQNGPSRLFDKQGGRMTKRITWNQIYRDFEKRHPRLSKHVLRYTPFGYLQIMVYMDDGAKISYDFFTSSGKFV